MIIEFAIGKTVDPMPEVMEKLFEKCEIIISNKVLELMKKMHSYTKIKDEYIFHRRTRGTDALFSFVVTTGNEKGNKVSDFECINAEIGLFSLSQDSNNEQCTQKVYFTLQGEE